MSSDNKYILDTVVLLYFPLADEGELLGKLIGWPFRVPFAVYDPEEQTIQLGSNPQPELLSEMRQVVTYYEGVAKSTGDTESLWRVSRVDRLYEEERVVVEAMKPREQRLADKLQGSDASQLGLLVPLGPGEAACVAIAHEREWTIVTDDTDALKALAELQGTKHFRYERIRKLLIRAAHEQLITEDIANRIHADMVSRGFWDSISPLPVS